MTKPTKRKKKQSAEEIAEGTEVIEGLLLERRVAHNSITHSPEQHIWYTKLLIQASRKYKFDEYARFYKTELELYERETEYERWHERTWQKAERWCPVCYKAVPSGDRYVQSTRCVTCDHYAPVHTKCKQRHTIDFAYEVKLWTPCHYCNAGEFVG